ncbi:hypothetical protein F5878DRAFT_242452 [Lentinula raphanica]|uniref:Uncharacterized protein n=1 Tax=Lentinula raphanica TaxID=153919 RepID=A0AA38P5U8_9AGAR|nr:hypothetical protein F5878DRAFT_242452 [Lentinula raphanica]
MTAHTITTIRALEPRASATLALTSDAAIEYIIADIPFYCIGLVAFAFFTFMLFMRRVNLLSIYLYTTALFSFVAAVIDLAQILARGSVKVDMDTGKTSRITALINTREVGLSIAIGLRFLFFWAFVAERPRGEPPPTTDLRDPQVYVHYAENFHSAKWERWGYLGILLKWSILASVFSIPVLQIIWRIAEGHYGVVYMVESTIEILVSALFLLKVFLNVFLSPVSPWWKPFQFYAVPLIALLINLGLGIGDLIYFRFSETALGRFLQAFEVYLLIIFIMLVAFYKVPVRPIRPSTSLPYVVEKKPNSIRPTLTTAPEVAEPSTVVNEPRFTYERPTSLAILPRVSSWISTSRRQTRYYQQNTGDAEAALGPSDSLPVVQQISRPISVDKDTQGPAQESAWAPPSPKHKLSTESVDYSDLFVRPRPTPPAFSSSVLLPEKDQRRSRPESRISNDVSLRYYGVGGAEDSTMSLPNPSFMLVDEGSLKSTGTDSPIYGLDGIMNQQTNRSSALSLLPPPRRPSSTSFEQQAEPDRSIAAPSMSSFDELLQQQAELDRSIAALRLFSPPASFAEGVPPQAGIPDATSPETTNSSNDRTLSTLTTSSARSEFSLSKFPDPPAADFPSRGSFATMRASRSKRLSRRDVPTSFDSASLDVPSLPVSPTRPAPGRTFGSNATQYDVTSFIGHLTRPSLTEGTTQSEGANPASVATEPNDARDRSENHEQDTQDEVTTPTQAKQNQYPPLRPFFLGNVTTSPMVSSPLAEDARNAAAPSSAPRKPILRGRLALPSNPRPTISGPMQSSLDQSEPSAFESPRSPPSVSQVEKTQRPVV